MNNKIKVLAFDSWTGGIHNYVRLLNDFKENNIEMFLVHLGSWGNDTRNSKKEYINNLEVRDISYYKNQNFENILDIEKPNLVLFLSTGTFAHRAFQRYCLQKNIPTINLAHGILSVGHYKGNDAPVKINIFAHIRWLLSRTKTTFLYAVPVYAKSLYKTKATFSEWKRLFSDLFDRVFYKETHKLALDARSSIACVFVDAEIEDISIRYNLDRTKIKVVGNPDLIHFNITEDKLCSCLKNNVLKNKDVMYIDCGMTHFGVYFKSQNEYCEFISNISKKLAEFGFNLIFKIKPQDPQYIKSITELISSYNIELIQNTNFQERLSNCVACITEPSTLGVVPELFALPVFLNQLGPLSDLQYGDIFTLYPRAFLLKDLNEFNNILVNEVVNINKTELWIKNNSGPLPASDMPKRVVKVIYDLI
jgi:hypothetical protein